MRRWTGKRGDRSRSVEMVLKGSKSEDTVKDTGNDAAVLTDEKRPLVLECAPRGNRQGDFSASTFLVRFRRLGFLFSLRECQS